LAVRQAASVRYGRGVSERDRRIGEWIGPHAAAGERAYYLAYFDCFNQGRFYEAHEVLEELWRGKHGSNRRFYQGLIQLAGAFVHFQKNRLRPAVALLGLARENLQAYPTFHEGLSLEETLALIERWTNQVVAGGHAHNPYREECAPRLRLRDALASEPSKSGAMFEGGGGGGVNFLLTRFTPLQ
jgi:hypothetical protein